MVPSSLCAIFLATTLPETPTPTPAPTPAIAKSEKTPAPAVPQQQAGRIEWRGGSPVFVSEDGRFTFRPLAQLQIDAATTTGARDDRSNITKTGVRAAHLGFAGNVGDHLVYQFETELANGSAQILWAYAGWRGHVAGIGADVLVGSLQNDRGVEGSSGGEALPFLEANFVASVIAPERGGFGLGTQARLIGNGWHVSASITGDDINARRALSDGRTMLARAHWNPLHDTRGTIHLGGWIYDEQLSGAPRTLTPGANVAHGLNVFTIVQPRPLLNAKSDTGTGVEAGGVAGPVWVMGEAGWRSTARNGQTDARSNAASLSAGWFVTGGTPYYTAATGGFGRPSVKHPVFEGGAGEIELTTRYEIVRFRTDGLRDAGSAFTGGINWYLNDMMRVMVNGTAWRLRPDTSVPGTRPDRGYTFAARTQIVL